jgi:hypothetical protein
LPSTGPPHFRGKFHRITAASPPHFETSSTAAALQHRRRIASLPHLCPSRSTQSAAPPQVAAPVVQRRPLRRTAPHRRRTARCSTAAALPHRRRIESPPHLCPSRHTHRAAPPVAGGRTGGAAPTAAPHSAALPAHCFAAAPPHFRNIAAASLLQHRHRIASPQYNLHPLFANIPQPHCNIWILANLQYRSFDLRYRIIQM